MTVYYRFFRFRFGRYEKRNRAKPKTRLAAGQKLRVLFIIQYPEMWNSEKSLVDELLAHPSFEPILLCVPKYSRQKTGGAHFSEQNAAYDFLAAAGYEPINAFDGNWVSLKALDPDYIFVQRPYTVELPPPYSFRRLLKQASLCYIPYSGRMTRGVHIGIEFNKDFLRAFSVCFADCQDSFNFVNNWVSGHGLSGLKRVYEVGFPRFDLLKALSSEPAADKSKSRFLWLPRWSLSDYNDKSHFLDYIEPMLSYFAEHPDFELVIRPHPLMFANFVRLGAMTEEQVETLKSRIDRLPNVAFDPDPDYLNSFQKTDILISDSTSLLLEFFPTRKPVVFCGEYKDLTAEGALINETFYAAACFEDVETSIEAIVNGDPKQAVRRQNFEALSLFHENAGANIREVLLAEAQP